MLDEHRAVRAAPRGGGSALGSSERGGTTIGSHEASEPVGGQTLAHLLDHHAYAHPQRDALVAPEGRFTYEELAGAVRAVASWLDGLGLADGARVGVLFPNGARWAISALAAQHLGRCVVPLNTWYHHDELEEAIERAGVGVVLVADEELFGRDYVAMLKQIAGSRPSSVPAGVHPWSAVAPLPPDAEGDAGDPRAAPDDHAYLLFTSGSTAKPKGVLLPHRSLVQVGHDTGVRLRISADDRIWMPGPLFFARASANGVPTWLAHGATLCLQDRFEAGEALALLASERCSVFFANGVHARRLVDHPDFGRTDLSSLRTGTGAATPQEKAFLIDVVGVEGLSAVYGMTESCGVSTITWCDDPREVRLHCAGAPIPSQEVRITVDGAEAAAGTEGQIELRGAIFDRYLDDEANVRAFTADGWFRTGDLGWMDHDGRLHFAGRSTDMIKTKGINVSPAEVEAAVRRCAGVGEVVVFPRSDPLAGELVLCAVVPADPTITQTDEKAADRAAALVASITAQLREAVASYKVPSEIRLLSYDQLPIMATGKVNRRLLRQAAETGTDPWADTVPLRERG